MNEVLAQYGRLLCRQWRCLVWGVILAVAVTAAALFVQPPMYRSSALILVRTPGDVSQVRDGGDAYAQQRAKTFAVVAKSTTLSSSVISHLGLDIDPQTLSDRISAANRPGTALIDLSVEAPSAAEAQRTASMVVADYTGLVRGLETVPGSVVPRAELVVVDRPGRASRALGWGLPLQLVIMGMALAGLVAGACAAVLRGTFADSERPPFKRPERAAVDAHADATSTGTHARYSRRVPLSELRRRR